uniref:Tetratricopeptide repeat protein n=1 Tax=Anopheles epiroticus TaxID=199890 RepID=A0A182P6X1_9DIPT
MSSESLVRPGLTTRFTGSLPEIKLRLRKKVPKLTANDVRRARIPYYEAIASELYEAGYVSAAFLLLHLIEYEDAYVGRTSYAAVESRRLQNDEMLLNPLCDSLARAENWKAERQYVREVGELLAIARRLEPVREKRWLARQFFCIALDRCADCDGPERVKAQSLVRYYYGKFLIDLRQHLEAMKLLEQADEELGSVSPEEIDSWETLEEDGERLSIAINTLLFVSNCKLAEELRGSPKWIAEQYIKDAHKAALKSLYTLSSIMARSYQAYGEFLCDKGCHEEALEMYRNALQQAELDGELPELAVSVALAQAKSYHRLSQAVKRDAMLHRVDRMTKSNENSLNRAHYYLVAATLQQQDAKEDANKMAQLLTHLRLAASIFERFRQRASALEARCLEGLLRAEPLFAEYAILLPRAISTSDGALYRVIDRVGF